MTFDEWWAERQQCRSKWSHLDPEDTAESIAADAWEAATSVERERAEIYKENVRRWMSCEPPLSDNRFPGDAKETP